MNIVIAVGGRGGHRRRTTDPPFPQRFSIDNQQRCDQLDKHSESARGIHSGNVAPHHQIKMYGAGGDEATHLSFAYDLHKRVGDGTLHHKRDQEQECKGGVDSCGLDEHRDDRRTLGRVTWSE